MALKNGGLFSYTMGFDNTGAVSTGNLVQDIGSLEVYGLANKKSLTVANNATNPGNLITGFASDYSTVLFSVDHSGNVTNGNWEGSVIGVPYGGTGASTLGSGLPLFGAGTSPITTGTLSGNTTKLATSSGTLTNGDCVQIDSHGNYVDAGASCLVASSVVSSFNTRTGAVTFTGADLLSVLPTPTPSANSLLEYNGTSWSWVSPSVVGGVNSFNTRTGAVTLTAADVGAVIVATPTPHEWLTGINSSGAFSFAQPAFTDISGTLAAGSQLSGIVALTNGGTGIAASTDNQLFTDLSPMGVNGDMIYQSAGAATRLPIGSSGEVLTVVGGAPVWTPSPAPGLTNPMTTGGDTIYGGSSGTPTRLANGSYAQVLNSGGGTAAPFWGNSAEVHPQGRLTLSSTLPVITSDTTAATSVYYLPYAGQIVPIYDGTALSNQSIGSGLTMTLNTSNQTSGNVYDLFVFLNSGTPTIGAGPAWSSTTSRGTGAGTTQLAMQNGIWTNAVSITLKNGSTSYSSITANEATYVGSIYMTANGQTGVMLKPSAASGGGANIIGVYNAYNRIRATAISRDSSTGYTYASATWREMDNSASNRVSWLDGLQSTPVKATLQQEVQDGTSTDVIFIGVNLNATTGAPGVAAALQSATSGNAGMPVSNESFYPQLGFNYIQAMESVNSGTGTFSNSAANLQALSVDLEF
jgi:hypothetical protein